MKISAVTMGILTLVASAALAKDPKNMTIDEKIEALNLMADRSHQFPVTTTKRFDNEPTEVTVTIDGVIQKSVQVQSILAYVSMNK